MLKMAAQPHRTGLAHTVFLGMLVLAALAEAAPVTAACSIEVTAAERMLNRAKPPALARGRAQRELDAAKQAPSERLCRKHLEAAKQYIEPEEPVAAQKRGAAARACGTDLGCQRDVLPNSEYQPGPGAYSARRCRQDSGCPD